MVEKCSVCSAPIDGGEVDLCTTCGHFVDRVKNAGFVVSVGHYHVEPYLTYVQLQKDHEHKKGFCCTCNLAPAVNEDSLCSECLAFVQHVEKQGFTTILARATRPASNFIQFQRGTDA